MFCSLSPGLILPWRWLAVAGEVPVVVMMALLCFMPTSPRYLIMKGNKPKAVQSLEWLRGPDSDYLTEIDKIERSVNTQVNGFYGGYRRNGTKTLSIPKTKVTFGLDFAV